MFRMLYDYQLNWPAWKFGILKISMLALGIIVGSTFPDFWRPLHVFLWPIFGITAVVAAIWGFRAMIAAEHIRKQSRKDPDE
ncbi:hypothetical protein [Rubinisphaera brasiliensis]|uniref:Two-component system histidine kinase n=1 Tax=Rubinisphaera brasiliensis (strain ATCC 49424 / DSM 5305 / JCM 21570 / IAM 15109 / NBRC 103401 / IFAM 1448) TaxID=756272 RepID=F0SJ13_RUBBR|nr:hypothetical protein [Rubinisphaera brasiliensis]ADY58555.1 two-component system histidine kinase [Rubinisphaera brasiliensis DSM 5305]